MTTRNHRKMLVQLNRWLWVSVALLSLGVMALACNLGSQASADSSQAGTALPTAGSGTIISATSSVPTSTPKMSANSGFPPGTLILTQLGNPIAQPPGSTQTIALSKERFGNEGSPDGRYGVRTKPNNNLFDLTLVDFSSGPNGTEKEVPQGKGFSAPGVAWKRDSSGFAFYDLPPSAKPGAGGIFFYDIASGQSKQLLPPPQGGQVAAGIAFSPDGKYLAYALGNAGSEGIGGPDSKLFLLDTTSNQSIALPAGVFGFTRWLKDSKGFIVRKPDAKGASQIFVYTLDNINSPKQVTPTNTSDFLVDVSTDSKHLVVSSAPVGQGQIVQIYTMNLDGSSRKMLTKFTSADQVITGLVWANDGIYYSISGADNKTSTWRMDLDGSNAAQVAQGTLNRVVGT